MYGNAASSLLTAFDTGEGVGQICRFAITGFRTVTSNAEAAVADSVDLMDDDGRRLDKVVVRATAEF